MRKVANDKIPTISNNISALRKKFNNIAGLDYYLFILSIKLSPFVFPQWLPPPPYLISHPHPPAPYYVNHALSWPLHWFLSLSL